MRRAVVLAIAALAALPSVASGADPVPGHARVAIALARPTASFRPDLALGAGLDGHDAGDIPGIYTATNERAMATAGLGAVTYRLRTELGVETWHWNPRGTWSDPQRRQGYWISSPYLDPRVRVTYGYRLPRRGDTFDQADDDGYSRLDDGRPGTFWKSDPYLDPYFTHQPAAAHPQWTVVDLGRPRPVDALRIDWGTPYAVRFSVQRWTGGPSAVQLAGHPPGRWTPFRDAAFGSRGGMQTVRLAPHPVRARFVRVLLLQASGTAPPGSHDVRDRLGFAVRELGLGLLARGRFHDLVRHGASNATQTPTWVSSTDPWHRASDRDPHTDQPSFTQVRHSGLTRGMPMLVPVGVLYDTPANAAAELRWLRSAHVPLRGVEIGEEPDGQLVTPEDYGALYAQWARALHRVDPGVPFGGPGFQTSIPDWVTWPNATGNRSWVNRFLAELRARRALGALRFFSFEWYPFDNTCGQPARQLRMAPGLLASALHKLRRAGVSQAMPKYVTEYGYSAFSGRAEVGMPGALFDSQVAAQVLTSGGTAAYLYGYEPDVLIRELRRCDSWGNLLLFESDYLHRILHPLATYWAMRMVTRDWAGTGSGIDRAYRTSVDARDAAGHPLVVGFTVRRPDRRLAVLLVNDDPYRTWDVRLPVPRGPLDLYRFSGAQYAWRPHADRGFPRPDAPPVHAVLDRRSVSLPPYSVSVVRTGAAPTVSPAIAARGVLASRRRTRGDGWAWLTDLQPGHLYTDRDVGAAGVGMGLLAASAATGDLAFLHGAQHAGDFLLAAARRTRGGLAWPDFSDRAGPSDTAFRSFDDGAPGIADFLWRLGPRYRRAAAAGIRWIAGAAAGVDGRPCPQLCRWRYYDSARDYRTGMGEGASGDAWALDAFARRTGDAGFERIALGAARYLERLARLHEAVPERPGRPFYDTGFLSGAAGDAFLFLTLYEHTQDARWLDDAERLLAWLRAHAVHEPGGGFAWPIEVDPVHGYDDRLATGIEEGAAGIGWVELQAWRLTHAPVDLRTAVGAGSWLSSVALHEDGGLAWPEDAGRSVVHVGLNNGTAGVGWFLDDLGRVTGNPEFAAEAASARTWLVAVARRGSGGPWWFDERAGGRWLHAHDPSWHWGAAGIAAFLARLDGWPVDMPGEEPGLG